MDPKDNPKPEEKKEEIKPEIKSWSQLRKVAKEQAKEKYAKKLGLEVKEEKKDETPINKEPISTPNLENEKEEVKTPKEPEPRIDVDAVARKAAEEAANKVAESAKADKLEFQAKLDAILDKDKDIQLKQKEADELISSWDRENRLPKDYKELIDETMRIADAKMAHKQREAEARVQEDKPKEQIAINPEQKRVEDFEKEVVSDLQEIYDANLLPKPANIEEINNPNTTDEAAKETQKILEFGVKLNTERVKNGLPPVTSLNKIYFIHYQPTLKAQGVTKSNQPAGADAPVSPSSNQSVTSQNTPQPFYQKGEDGHYRPKSWAQIKYEALKSRVGK